MQELRQRIKLGARQHKNFEISVRKNRPWGAEKLKPEVTDQWPKNLIKILNPSCCRLPDENPEEYSKSVPAMIKAKCPETK